MSILQISFWLGCRKRQKANEFQQNTQPTEFKIPRIPEIEQQNENGLNLIRPEPRVHVTPILQSLMTTSYTDVPQPFIPVSENSKKLSSKKQLHSDNPKCRNVCERLNLSLQNRIQRNTGQLWLVLTMVS